MTSLLAKQKKRDTFTRILEDMEKAMLADPSGDTAAIIDAVLDDAVLSYKGG